MIIMGRKDSLGNIYGIVRQTILKYYDIIYKINE